MKDGAELQTATAIENRIQFLSRVGMSPDRAAIHFADFTTTDFCVYQQATPGLMPGVDAVGTNDTDQPIMLPLADCVGAVLYDPVHHAIMVSHLGRHSTEQFGGVKSVEYMAATYHARPSDLLVWLGPSPSSDEYPLWAFNNRGFIDVLCEQLELAGVHRNNIEVSAVDTATDVNYFSHSQFLQGNRPTDGRYAIAVMLR